MAPLDAFSDSDLSIRGSGQAIGGARARCGVTATSQTQRRGEPAVTLRRGPRDRGDQAAALLSSASSADIGRAGVFVTIDVAERTITLDYNERYRSSGV